MKATIQEAREVRGGAGRPRPRRVAGRVGGLLALCATAMLVPGGGCPVPEGGLPRPPGDPAQRETGLTVNIRATAGILQFNELGFDTGLQQRATLTAVVTQPAGQEQSFTVAWTINPPAAGESLLAFGLTGSSQTASGPDAIVRVTEPAVSDVIQSVTAVVTLADSTVLDPATIELLIRRDIAISDVESTVLQANPFTTPSVGVDANNQVLLNAGVSGNTGLFTAVWSPIDTLPAELSLPDPPTGDPVALTVSGPASGVFRFLVTVTDSAEKTAVGIVNVFLGRAALLLDAAVTRLNVSPNASTIGLRTTRIGGVDDVDPATDDTFVYAFQILRDNDTDVTGSATVAPDPSAPLDDAVIDWTITGLTTPGSYRVIISVSDAQGLMSAADSVTVWLTNGLALAVEPQFDRVGAGRDFNLRTVRGGGQPGFTYTFAAIDSSGADAPTTFTPPSGTTDNDATNDWLVSGFATPGTYRIFVTVRDGTGNRVTSSTEIDVGDVLGIDVRSSSYVVAPGESVTLTFDQTGGTGDYSYAFSADGPNAGSTFGDASPITAEGDATTTWTAPAASTTTAGSYRITATVTDDLGHTSTDSLWILVQSADPLSLDVRSSDHVIAPGDSVTITFDQTGGSPNYDYVFSAAGPGGAGTFVPASPINNDPNDATTTWTAPAAGPGVEGAYRITCTVTDELGNSFVDSLWIVVQTPEPLSLDVRSSNHVLAPGGSATITFDQTGGVANYDYVFSAAGPGGAGTFVPASPINNDPDDATSVWTAPAAGPGVEGAYRITCTVTDEVGNTFVDSIWILVETPEPLSLDVRASNYMLAPGGSATITFDQTGGVANYDYVFSASGPGGAGAFVPASPINNDPDDATSVWTAPAAGPGVEGAYRIECTVTDELGNSFVDSLWIQVQAADRLSVDIDADSFVLGPGVPVRVTASVSGGQLNYDYAFSARDPQGDAIPSSSFNPDPPTFGGSANTSETVAFLPDSTPGTYRVTANVTDDNGDTADQTVHLLVTGDSSIVSADIYVNAADAQDAAELAAGDGDVLGAATAIDDTVTLMVFDAGDLDTQTLPEPRNLVFLVIDDAGADLVINSILITGTNGRGDTIQEEITAVNTDGTLTSGLLPFKTISNIVLDYANAALGDTIQIGVGDRFGLSRRFVVGGADSDAFHVVAQGTVIDANVTFLDPASPADLTISTADNLNMPTTAQQFIVFPGAAPDNTRDYVVQIGPDVPAMTVAVFASDYTLDESNGDIADITIDVTGGVPPYTFTYDDVGLTAGATFAPASGQTAPGDAATTWDPAAPSSGGPENYVIWVRVVDSAGVPNVATGSVIIQVVP